MEYLPSRKFFAVVFFTALLSGGVFFFASSKEVVVSEQVAVLQNGGVPRNDADGDGLSDWEEVLLGTDPQEMDSDGNGVSDGEQHKSTKKYKEIGAVIDYIDEALDQEDSYDPNNTTDSLFQNAGFQYGFLTAEQGGVTNTDLEKIKNDLSSKLSARESIPDRYSTRHVVVTKNDAEAEREYAKNILFAFAQFKMIYSIDPMKLFNVDADADADRNEKLSSLSGVYTAFAEKIIKIPVPPALAETHMELANNLYKTSIAVNDMKSVETDPVKGMLGAARYISQKSDRGKIVAYLTSYYAKNKN